MQLKRRKTDMGETLQWTDYMSLSFTQHVSRPSCPHGSKISLSSVIMGFRRYAHAFSSGLTIKSYMDKKTFWSYVGDNGDTADGQYYQRDHAQGGAGRRGEGASHPERLVRVCVLPIGPSRRQALR